MADSPTVAAIAAAIAGAVTGTVELVKRRKRTGRRVADPAVNALAATIGGLAQRLHDLENRMVRLETVTDTQLKKLDESLDGLELSHARLNTGITRDIAHIKETLREIKEARKGR